MDAIIINSLDAFDEAIDMGILSTDPDNEVFAGNYMYMYTLNNVNYFKCIETREYITIISF